MMTGAPTIYQETTIYPIRHSMDVMIGSYMGAVKGHDISTCAVMRCLRELVRSGKKNIRQL